MSAREFLDWERWNNDHLLAPQAADRLAHLVDRHLARLFAALVNMHREKGAPPVDVTEFLLMPQPEPANDAASEAAANAEFSRRLAEEIARHNQR